MKHLNEDKLVDFFQGRLGNIEIGMGKSGILDVMGEPDNIFFPYGFPTLEDLLNDDTVDEIRIITEDPANPGKMITERIKKEDILPAPNPVPQMEVLYYDRIELILISAEIVMMQIHLDKEISLPAFEWLNQFREFRLSDFKQLLRKNKIDCKRAIIPEDDRIFLFVVNTNHTEAIFTDGKLVRLTYSIDGPPNYRFVDY